MLVPGSVLLLQQHSCESWLCVNQCWFEISIQHMQWMSPQMCGACCRYSEAAAAAARIKELKAAEAERLKLLLTAAHQAELVQLQDNFQQV
jgi:hypothetical protein